MSEEKPFTKLTGSCLCGGVRFEASNTPLLFHYCSCESCRKVTGSAHASNLFVEQGDFSWIAGEDLIRKYVDTTKNPGFTSCFCSRCGSFLPHLGRSGQHMVIPAGVLDTEPSTKPSAVIYCSEMPRWYVSSNELEQHVELPPEA